MQEFLTDRKVGRNNTQQIWNLFSQGIRIFGDLQTGSAQRERERERFLWFVLISEAQSWRKRSMTHQCSHEGLPQVLTRVLTQVYTRVPTKVGYLCVIVPYKGSHSSAHVSAHAGAHASVHEVVWSYVTWSVFIRSVPYPSDLLGNKS